VVRHQGKRECRFNAALESGEQKKPETHTGKRRVQDKVWGNKGGMGRRRKPRSIKRKKASNGGEKKNRNNWFETKKKK